MPETVNLEFKPHTHPAALRALLQKMSLNSNLPRGIADLYSFRFKFSVSPAGVPPKAEQGRADD